MPIGITRADLREALRWSGGGRVDGAQMLAAGLGMAAPAALGLMLGHPRAGMAAALGALMVAGTAPGAGAAARARALLSALAATGLAVLASAVWPADTAALVGLSALAAWLGGRGYAEAVAATRFVLFLVLLRGLDAGLAGTALVATVLAGALWAALLNLTAGVTNRRRAAAAAPRHRFPGWAKRWRYPSRLAVGLLSAVALQALWPSRDLHWIAVTVVILAERRTRGAVTVKILQRTLGTALGVLLAGLMLGAGRSPWWLVAGIGLLAAVRPPLRERHYLAYSAVMTPLIVLLLDAGRGPEPGLLLNRLLATLAGAALVIASHRLLPDPPR